jgi:hypothetical protein
LSFTADCRKPPLEDTLVFGDPLLSVVLTVVPLLLPVVVVVTICLISLSGVATVPVVPVAVVPPLGDEGDESDGLDDEGLDDEGLSVPPVPSSACATAAPPIIAAPTPRVIAPAPSHA